MAASDFTEALIHPSPEAVFVKNGVSHFLSLRQPETLFQDRLTKPGASPRVLQTSTTQSVRHSAPKMVDTTTPPRVAYRITETSPRVGTHKTLAPTIPSACTIQYRYQENKISII